MNIGKLIGSLTLVAAGLAIGAAWADAQSVHTAMNEPARPSANATPFQWAAPVSGPANSSTLLHTSEMPGVPGKELRVFRTTYPPGAVNPKHYHTSQVVFFVVDGAAVFQEEGQTPVTLKAGDSLVVKPGTIHAHWNASTTAPLVSHEVVIVEVGQRSTIKMP
jgi:quercetin dioxygenase-like cupin family protein